LYRPKIKAVLFDWGKVVAVHDNSRAASAFCAHSGLLDATDEMVEKLIFYRHRPLFDRLMCGTITADDYRTIVRSLLCLPDNFDDRAFDQAFGDVFTKNEAMIRFIGRLREAGVTLTAVSNMDELRHRQLTALGVHDLFDEHLLSYREGMMKPDPEIYRRAFGRSGVDSSEALFVDDHEENTAVAASLGAHVWTYDYRNHEPFERFLLEGFKLGR